jgi:excisionase family DNA binding protein
LLRKKRLPNDNTQTVTFLSVREAAEKTGKTRKTILAWCHSGKLPATAIDYGQKLTFKIPPSALELIEHERVRVTAQKEKAPKGNDNHKILIPNWIRAMQKGLIAGKAFSPLTVIDYQRHVQEYFAQHRMLTVQAVKCELMKCPVEQAGRRIKYHKSMVCFAKFLYSEGLCEDALLQALQRLRPKAHRPPKRLVVNENELQTILNACISPFERLLVTLLASTGLRASECAAIRHQDIDLDSGCLSIPIAKGGKARKVGLSPVLSTLLKEYEPEIKQEGNARLFYEENDKPSDRYALYRHLKRIGKRAGVRVTPHALRRAFVTINANKGRSLVILQRSCGHSSIKTTMSYCRTSEQEVIEAMKGWD